MLEGGVESRQSSPGYSTDRFPCFLRTDIESVDIERPAMINDDE